jgi:DNA-binding Xre family transcriptional regulator
MDVVNLWTSLHIGTMLTRLRLPELLQERGLTAYGLAKLSNGALSRSMAYRLVAERGAFRCLSPEQLDALCDALGVPPGELFERRPAAKKGKRS